MPQQMTIEDYKYIQQQEVAQRPQLFSKAQVAGMLEGSKKIQRELFAIEEERGKKLALVSPAFRADIIREKKAQINADYNAKRDEQLLLLRKNAEMAKAQMAMWEPRAVMRRAVFDEAPDKDAIVRGTWLTRIAKAPPHMLEQFATMAATDCNLALANVVQEEIEARGELPETHPAYIKREARTKLRDTLAMIPSDSAEVTTMLREAVLVHDESNIKSGRDRIAVGIQRGLLGG
jgi:hypothetical protein